MTGINVEDHDSCMVGKMDINKSLAGHGKQQEVRVKFTYVSDLLNGHFTQLVW